MELDFEWVEKVNETLYGFEVVIRTPVSAEDLIKTLCEIRRQHPLSNIEIDTNYKNKIVIEVECRDYCSSSSREVGEEGDEVCSR